MKIIAIASGPGVQQAYACKKQASNGESYYALTHGEEGRGRWEIRIPLAKREFPVAEATLPLDGEYKLVDLHKQDPQGNPQYLLAKGQEDGDYLVLWSLSPGFRGGATYEVAGSARVLGEGTEAQGTAGRMGGAACPVVLTTGPCGLSWRRSGRLYGDPADWTASFDGAAWTVAPTYQCAAEEAALNY